MFEAPYQIEGVDDLPSPSLVVFRALVERNIDAMLHLVGDPARLRPHAKTHKMPAVIQLLESRGIHQHKCATLAEAEMIARAGGRDVLLAYPLVGPNIRRFVRLVAAHPETTFRATVDTRQSVTDLAEAARVAGLDRPIPVLVDINVGMGRTGTTPLGAIRVAGLAASHSELSFDGLHVYDGHVRESDLGLRTEAARGVEEEAYSARFLLQDLGHSVTRIVLGGTPSFPIHASAPQSGLECSPGTCIFHDHGYGSRFPDLPFTPAALILTRVISRPGRGKICLDVGSKAVAADPPGDRVRLLGLPTYTLGPQSEEHLVVECPASTDLVPGTPLLAIPTHICPTVALHPHALVIDQTGRVVDRWDVGARDRELALESRGKSKSG
jgi:D-serine deaminase-like pyridoxal phosphate-dependent protein